MANNNEQENFYKRLTKLFRSGPAIRRKIKGQNYKNYYDTGVIQNNLGYYGAGSYKREASPFSILGAYGLLDRMSRYNEFAEMDSSSPISTALDIYADESCASDEHGKSFHVYSENPQIQKALEELFYEIGNIEFDARRWYRNLVKNGDFFMYVEVVPDYGVVKIEPIPVNEIEREEGYDPTDPYAVRFKLLTRGGKYIENWQMLHMRILSNDLFIPYGTSFLESARKPWRQLIMMEDAMLVYRVVRSPERRVYYIDVSGIQANDIPNYMEAVKETMRGSSIIDKISGRQDFRYNPVSVNDDIFLPSRPNSQTKIETLAGGQHVSATEDVEYLLSKLIAALKVPKPYLTFDEGLSSKANLSQEDIRFSRTIHTLQKIVLSELNKLAILHLYAIGFDGEDLLDFEIKFSNPSTVALQQKLALIASRLETAGKAWDLAKETGMLDMEYIQKEILGFRMNEIVSMRLGSQQDQLRMAELKSLLERKPEENNDEESIVDPFAGSYDVPVTNNMSGSEENPTGNNGQPIAKVKLPSISPNSTQTAKYSLPIGSNPITPNATPNLSAAKLKDKRRKTYTGIRALGFPDYQRMLDTTKNRYMKDPFDMEFIKNPLKEIFLPETREKIIPRGIHPSVVSSMKKFNESVEKNKELIDIDFIKENEENTNTEDPFFEIEKELFEKNS